MPSVTIRQATILYEDQAVEGEVTNYGPHALVLQLLCDRLGEGSGINRWALKKFINGVPKKGASKLREECRLDRPRFGRDGRRVFAVYDADKICHQLKLPPQACKRQIIDVLRGESSLGDQLIIVLLEMNIETVIEAVCDCDPTIPAKDREDAIVRKQLNARDRLLHRAASASRSLRRDVLGKVPSLAYMIDKLAGLLLAP
jgi:hypothetical protein